MEHTKTEIGKAVAARIAEGYGRYTNRYKAFDFFGIVTMKDGTPYHVSCRWPDGQKVADVEFTINNQVKVKKDGHRLLSSPCVVCGDRTAAAKVKLVTMKCRHGAGYLREVEVPLCRQHVNSQEVIFRKKACVPLGMSLAKIVEKDLNSPKVRIGVEILPGLYCVGKLPDNSFGMGVDVTTGEVYRGKPGFGMQKEAYCITVPKMPLPTSANATWRKWAGICREAIESCAP